MGPALGVPPADIALGWSGPVDITVQGPEAQGGQTAWAREAVFSSGRTSAASYVKVPDQLAPDRPVECFKIRFQKS